MTRYRINPGEFRNTIVFQKINKDENDQNDYGEPVEKWDDIITTKAGIYPLSGETFFAAEKENSKITHKINMRYIPGITTDMRIKFGERFFQMVSPPINFQERNIELQILCKELV